MIRYFLALLTLMVLPTALADVKTAPATKAAATTTAAPATTPEAFWNADALHVLHLKLARAAWDKMQPTRAGLFSGLLPPATRPAGEEVTHASPFGYHYVFVHADLEFGGRTYANVGLRFKGNSSYLTGSGVKKPFKLDLNHFERDQTVAGVSELNLNNSAMDPTFMREAMSYQFFRDAGVPASRTAWALVYLSVADLHQRKLAGLYTIVEEINKPFLKAHFGSAKGLLLKPENAFSLPYLGEDFSKYEKMYRPKTVATPETSRRLIDFLKLVHQADDATFERSIGDYLDIESFLSFVAANSLLGNMDSFLSTGHNFYIYIHPKTLKAHFIPWDLNLSFGTFDWVGTIGEQAQLSLTQPYVRPNRLTERLLSIDRYAQAYRAEVARIAKTCMTAEHVRPRIKAFEEVIARAERLANVAHKPLPASRPAEFELGNFLAARARSVEAQLAGTDEGYAPYWQKGMFGGHAPRPAAAAAAATHPAPTTRPTTTKPSEKK
jgi:spore coat protein H